MSKIKDDLALRILAALTRTDAPIAPCVALTIEDGTVVGTVPLHLRHLHNLVDELTTEVIPFFTDGGRSEARLTLIRTLFYASLEPHLLKPEGEYSTFATSDWTVIAVPMSPEHTVPPMIDKILRESADKRRWPALG